ncbi:sporulation initiation phosphotransferase B [Anoxybacteroides rupiense]|uniref:sporulation initiation phosphotransferase B n=1 Tax=Anoxybacteroides rupiense TaxID=311460 RepID=UPI001F0955F6|nr:sporulation initiation phosphotransferase B [Anoxybacillus rupiensis]
MKEKWSILDALRHSWHDWLNKIQLIKGNLALNKIERVHEIIEEIVRDMQHETKLTNLGAKQFAELLMTYNWEAKKISISYEVLGDGCDLSAHDSELTEWCRAFLQVMEQQADMNRESHLEISIEAFDAEVRLFFDYSGTISDENAFMEWLNTHERGASLCLEQFSIHKDEMTVAIKIARKHQG